MKKIIAFLLALVMCFTLCACGGSEAATVTVSGQEEQMSAQDIMDKYDENPAAYLKDYKGAEIVFVGTVEKIELDTEYCVEENRVSSNGGNVIVFEEGFRLILSEKNTSYDMADISVGDKLKVTSAIGLCPEFDTDFLQDCFGEERCVWVVGDDKFGSEQYKYNNITTTIEAVE